jgi:hypothetical protein
MAEAGFPLYAATSADATGLGGREGREMHAEGLRTGRRNRITAGVVGAAALLSLAAAGEARADTYCFPSSAISALCDASDSSLQGTLNLAQTHAGEDTVFIGAGNHVVPGNQGYNDATAGNAVHIEGLADATLTLGDTTGSKTALLVSAPAGSALQNLSIVIPADVDGTGNTGLNLSGSVLADDVEVRGQDASNASGVALGGQAVLRNSEVDLETANSPDNIAVRVEDGTPAVTDSELVADWGFTVIGFGATGTVERSVIQASLNGLAADTGTIVARNSVIDLGTSDDGAVGVEASNHNNGTTPIDMTLDHMTIVGGGANSVGVRALADSEQLDDPAGDDGSAETAAEANDTVDDGENTDVDISNTVIFGPATSISVGADRGQSASVSTSYSSFDSSTAAVSSDLSGHAATGTAELVQESNINDVDPLIGGDYHLSPASPLLDAGDPAFAAGSQDLDREPRIQDGPDTDCDARTDIGADELLLASPSDCTPPETFISAGPSGVTKDTTPSFTLTATEPGSTFECRVVGVTGFVPCTSPHTTQALADGSYTFEARATDPSPNANVDPSPATRSFTIDTTAPQTTITGKPKKKSRKRRASFAHRSSEPGSTFLCSVDGADYVACGPTFRTRKLARGKHRFDVLATDAAGNRDPSAATYIWKVTKKKRKKRR